YAEGSSKVSKIAPDGTVSDAWTGLTAVTDLALGPDGTLYAAEMATVTTDDAPFLTPNTGKIVRQTGPETQEDVVTDLPYPTGIGFAADGRLVFDTPAFGPAKGVGLGVVAAIDPISAPISYAGVSPAPAACIAA